MTTFEEKVNAYRENKRLMEELEAMNDAIKTDIINMMHNGAVPEMPKSGVTYYGLSVRSSVWSWSSVTRCSIRLG